MEHLVNFQTVIQLIAGVNFAFILGDFLGSALKKLFNVEQRVEDNKANSSYIWVVEAESAKQMPIIRTDCGTSTKDTLETIKRGYDEISQQWKNLCDKLRRLLSSVSNRSGFQTIFLLDSIYCIVDLLMIGFCTKECASLCVHEFMFCLNILLVIHLTSLTYVVFTKGLTTIEKSNATNVLVLILEVIIAFAVLRCQFYVDFVQTNLSIIECVNFYGCLILPFWACAFSALFIVAIEVYIRMSFRIVSIIGIFKSRHLSKKKRELEGVNKLFKPDTDIKYE